MKKALKIIGIILAVLVVGFAIFYFATHEPEPEGHQASKADELAEKMMAAVDKTAWDSTRFVTWNFTGRHEFLWDKAKDRVQVKWGDFEVLLLTENQQGQAFVKGRTTEGEEEQELLQKAWEYFCNDGFWLNAVVKAKDPGTERSLVTLDDGREGLKVTYTSGGVTPGDTYVWLLDKNNRPNAIKMWVQVIPVGGIEFTCEDWIQLSTGAWIAKTHAGTGFTVAITDVKGGMTLEEVGYPNDPFLRM